MGLTVGTAGPGSGGITNAVRRFMAALVAELRGRQVELTVGVLAQVQSACRWERSALAFQRAARKCDAASTRHKAELLRWCAQASAARDAVLRDLGLDKPPPVDPMAELARWANESRPAALNGTKVAPNSLPTREPAGGPPAQPGSTCVQGDESPPMDTNQPEIGAPR